MDSVRKITVNGKEIDASQWQTLPEPVRKVLADKNNNGIPDVLEGLFDNPLVKQAMERAGYQSFEQIPPEMREKLQGILSKLGGGPFASPQVKVQNVSTASVQVPNRSEAPADWKQGYSLEEPKSISAKTIFAVLMPIFVLLVAAWAAWMLLAHR